MCFMNVGCMCVCMFSSGLHARVLKGQHAHAHMRPCTWMRVGACTCALVCLSICVPWCRLCRLWQGQATEQEVRADYCAVTSSQVDQQEGACTRKQVRGSLISQTPNAE